MSNETTTICHGHASVLIRLQKPLHAIFEVIFHTRTDFSILILQMLALWSRSAWFKTLLHDSVTPVRSIIHNIAVTTLVLT